MSLLFSWQLTREGEMRAEGVVERNRVKFAQRWLVCNNNQTAYVIEFHNTVES